MASRNADSITPAQGEIHASKPRSEPLTTQGHAPGVQASSGAKPTFTAATLPAGTAPASATYVPATRTPSGIAEGANNPSNEDNGGHTSAEATLMGGK